MNPVYLNPLPSPFPPLEHNEDQHFQFFNPPSEASSSSLSSFVFFNPTQEQRGSYDIEQQQQADKYVLHCGSSDHHFLPSPSLPTVENDINNGLKFSICKREDTDDNQINSGQVKWMSSKMRWMKKMNSDIMGADKPGTVHMNQDHPQPPSPVDTDNSSNNSNSKITVRVCADCNTTKTPLWRSGPRGPKSLCNACGIRQRKARRAMAAAASGTLLATNTSSMKTKVHRKEKRSDNGYVQQYKKRCNLTTPRSRKKLCFEDFTLNLSKSLAFHQVFPQDEKDAAILLMALSCGLVHG